MNSEQFFTMQDQEKIFVEIFNGDLKKRPIILLDGLGCSGFIWKKLRPWLETDQYIIHPHYRGHGRSPLPTKMESMSIQQVVTDIKDLLEQLNIDKCILIGHSMGVQVCLETWNQLREQITGIALLCGSYEHPIESWHGAAQKYAPPTFANWFMRKNFNRISQKAIKHSRFIQPLWNRLLKMPLSYEIATRTEVDGQRLSPQEFGPYLKDLANLNVGTFFSFARSLAEHSAAAYLRQINSPVLIVAGGRDTFTPAWRSEEMHHQIKGSTLLHLENGTHTAPLEYPTLLHAAVDRLIEEANK